jgi:hypothetical protein
VADIGLFIVGAFALGTGIERAFPGKSVNYLTWIVIGALLVASGYMVRSCG